MEDHEAQMSLKEVVAQCRDCKPIATSTTLNAHKLSNVFGSGMICHVHHTLMINHLPQAFEPFETWLVTAGTPIFAGCMLVFLGPSSQGVSNPELPSELDSVMSDPLDVLQSTLNPALSEFPLPDTSCEISEESPLVRETASLLFK